VNVDDNKFLHVRVFRPLPCNNGSLEVHSVQENKSEQDPLEYF